MRAWSPDHLPPFNTAFGDDFLPAIQATSPVSLGLQVEGRFLAARLATMLTRCIVDRVSHAALRGLADRPNRDQTANPRHTAIEATSQVIEAVADNQP